MKSLGQVSAAYFCRLRDRILAAYYEEYRALYALVEFRMSALDRRVPVTAAERLAAITVEYDDAMKAYREAVKAAKDKAKGAETQEALKKVREALGREFQSE